MLKLFGNLNSHVSLLELGRLSLPLVLLLGLTGLRSEIAVVHRRHHLLDGLDAQAVVLRRHAGASGGGGSRLLDLDRIRRRLSHGLIALLLTLCRWLLRSTGGVLAPVTFRADCNRGEVAPHGSNVRLHLGGALERSSVREIGRDSIGEELAVRLDVTVSTIGLLLHGPSLVEDRLSLVSGRSDRVRGLVERAPQLIVESLLT